MLIREEIKNRLQAAFRPTRLEVWDESAQHAGHAGARPGGNTHFRIKIEAEALKPLSRIARHRAIYAVLQDLMNNPIHALAIEG